MRLQRVHEGAEATGTNSQREASARHPIESALLGSWSATRWQYTSREHPHTVVDLVCDLGGSVTLSLSAEAYVLTWSSAGQDGRSIGGVLAVEGDRIALHAHAAGETEAVTYRLAGETLALSSDASRWDFNGDGAEKPADFVAVLVRL